MKKETDILKAELERLFELEELLDLSRNLLGFEPGELGETSAKGSFAVALARRCVEEDAIEALCDALYAIRPEVSKEVLELRAWGTSLGNELSTGNTFANFAELMPFAKGRVADSYLGERDGTQYRIKVLHPDAAREKRSLHRYLTASRISARIQHPALVRLLEVGQSGDRFYVAHEHVRGTPLGLRLERSGALQSSEALDISSAVLLALRALHAQRIAHGDVRLENVIVMDTPGAESRAVLVDVGSDWLRTRPRFPNGHTALFSTGASPDNVAPEQIRGVSADARSDLYSFGALLYQMLTGRAPFLGTSAIDLASRHLSEAPEPPSRHAPKGSVSRELDALTLRLLAKDPTERPPNADVVLEALASLATVPSTRAPRSREAIESLVERLKRVPSDDETAQQLEAAVSGGDYAAQTAETLLGLATSSDQPVTSELAKSLLLRAGRIASSRPETRDRAEAAYTKLLELEPDNRIVESALIEVRRRLGKFDEAVELLLARAERASSRREKSGCFAEIGRIFRADRSDRDQALVAFTQAYCEAPSDAGLLLEIESLAGSDPDAWREVLQSASLSAADPSLPLEDRVQLLCTSGRFWLERAQRPDMAVSCLVDALELDRASVVAWEGLCRVYRKTEAWSDLVSLLLTRADSAEATSARELRAEAAEVLESKLGELDRARALYEHVLAVDPGHVRACAALSRFYENEGNLPSLVRMLESAANNQAGEERSKTLIRIAELVESQDKDAAETERRFEAALQADPSSLPALRGLARVYQKTTRFKELLETLSRQIELSTTPRQKADLLERMAQILDEEFLDHEQAVRALTTVLTLDPSRESASRTLRRQLRALGQWEDLVRALDEEFKRTRDPERQLSALLEKADILERELAAPERALLAHERALELEPGHARALQGVARLRERIGDASAALKAIEALADKAPTPELKAEQWLRAAKLLESAGRHDEAIERYKRALEQNPKDRSAAIWLRDALVARGEVHSAIQVIERELEHAAGNLRKAELLSQIALLFREPLCEQRRAEEYARRAAELDPTQFEAQRLLGDLAFESERFLEACRHYEAIAGRSQRMEDTAHVLGRYVDALARTGAKEKSLALLDTLLAAVPNHRDGMLRAAQLAFQYAVPERAAEICGLLLERFGHELDEPTRARACYEYGEALRRAERLEACIPPLEQATELSPADPKPFIALSLAYEASGRFADVAKLKRRQVATASGELRLQLLLDLADLAASKLNDPKQTELYLLGAREIAPKDRRVLTKLMQLYSDRESWAELVEIVLCLAELVDDPKQKVKYLHSAAIVTAREIGDAGRALEMYAEILALEPSFERALVEAIELERARGNSASAERLLKQRLSIASAADDHAAMILTFDELGALYEKELGWIERAVDAYEAAQTLDPENRVRSGLLSQLYATDPSKYQERAIETELANLRLDPYRREPYSALRRLFTETKQADAAFCLCQALTVLGLAEPDEERFYRRMRSETAAPAVNGLSDDDWLEHVMHPSTDSFLSSVFALIEAAVIAKRGQSLAELGFDASFQLNLAEHPAPVCQSLYYAAGVLGVPLPPAYANPNDPGGVSFLFAHDPSLVLGLSAIKPDVPLQPAAFIAARSLTYLRPGMYLRHLLASSTALKAWLFAAIKLTAPTFPVPPELEGAVDEALSALDAGIQGPVRDHLTRVVSKLLAAETALDLRQWVAAVDLTADRAALIAAHDLAMTVQLIRASDEGTSSLSIEDRVREIVLYSVSPDYFSIRRRLGISVDG